jgi:cytochrome c peroxidase
LSGWAGATDATTTRHVEQLPRNFGEFKVPSLRLVAQTAPYMHDGQLKTLADVVRHYDEMNLERLHSDGEQILRPLHLSKAEREQLLAFLQTLSSPAAVRWRPSIAGPSNDACASRAPAQRLR